MKFSRVNFITIVSVIFFISCNGSHDHNSDDHTHEEAAEHHGHDEDGKVHLSAAQFNAMGIEIDTLPSRNLSAVVQASGQLEVPPQNEATVTAIIGANISSIKVIEGEEVKKGQALAYLSHPNLTRLQSDYLEAFNDLQFLEKEYERQKRLYEEEVGSGKIFQQTEADYRSAQAMEKSLNAQLRQLGISPSRIQGGDFYDHIPVASPIDGAIVKVDVKTGQYVPPEKELFEIVNTHHIHADLMVFEKDVYKVKVGQRVRFTVETLPGKELFAEIYSVGKKFERDPKAVHVHAEIENKSGTLIPGMYIRGSILTGSEQSFALPESAITSEGNRFLAFVVEKEMEDENVTWMFTPVEVRTGVTNNGWVAIKLLNDLPLGSLFAMNNAYYLLAEMKKGEAEHSH